MTTYIVFDAEYAIDRDAHRQFQLSEGYDSDREVIKTRTEWIDPRWVFRTPVTLSWMMLSEIGTGSFYPAEFKSIGQPEADLHQMLAQLSKTLARIPDATLVSWGGESSDVPQLRLAYMNAGLPLPVQLRAPFTGGITNPNHWDLCTKLCGKAASVHLNEMAAALGIPAKLTGTPGSVMSLIDHGKWSQVKAVCEGDVITTALVLMKYLDTLNEDGRFIGADNLLRITNTAAAKAHRGYSSSFADYAGKLEALPHPADQMLARELMAWSE
jgi:Predicted 3'-5' exonuclease related to the exonuclease domain of PolB